jgi:hypothetical protein
MGGWFGVGMSAVVAYLFYQNDQTLLMIMSVINVLVAFWSFGVMHNYASFSRRDKADILRENMRPEGRLDSDAETRLDELSRTTNPSAVPDWFAYINMGTSVIGVTLFICNPLLLLRMIS